MSFLPSGCSFSVLHLLSVLYVSILLSVFLFVFGKWIPLSGPLRSHPLLELAFAALLPSTGSAILFNMQPSTGGIDTFAMILRRKIPMNIGLILAVMDFLVDMVLTSSNEVKYFTIVSSRAEEISHYITEKLERGATILDRKGAYSGEEKGDTLCVVGRDEAVKLRDYTKSIHPNSFIMVTSTSQIIGKGFGSAF